MKIIQHLKVNEDNSVKSCRNSLEFTYELFGKLGKTPINKLLTLGPFGKFVLCRITSQFTTAICSQCFKLFAIEKIPTFNGTTTVFRRVEDPHRLTYNLTLLINSFLLTYFLELSSLFSNMQILRNYTGSK